MKGAKDTPLLSVLVLLAQNFVDPFKLEVDASALGAAAFDIARKQVSTVSQPLVTAAGFYKSRQEKLSRNTSKFVKQDRLFG